MVIFLRTAEPTRQWKTVGNASGEGTVSRARGLMKERIAEHTGSLVFCVPGLPPEGMPVSEWFDLPEKRYKEARLKTHPESDSR